MIAASNCIVALFSVVSSVSYVRIAQAVVPPTAFVALPRIAAIPNVPLVLAPTGSLRSSNVLLTTQGITKNLPPDGNDEYDSDRDSSFCDFQQEYSGSVTNSRRPPVLGPPNEFKDDGSDQGDSDFNDEDAQHYSRNLGTGGGTGRGTGSLHESRQPSLRASAEGAFRGPSPNMQSLGRESRASGGKSVSIKSRSREFPVAVQSNSPLHHTRGQNSYSVQDSIEHISMDRVSLQGASGTRLSLNDQSIMSGTGLSVESLKYKPNDSVRERNAYLEEQVQQLTRALEKENAENQLPIPADDLSYHVAEVNASAGMPARGAAESREELEKLKTLVIRLNVELDRYQKKFRPLSSSEMDEISSMPLKGPKPSWLLNVRYLAPLLMAYDDRLNEKDAIIEKYEVQTDRFREQVDKILKENDRLHIRLEQTDAVGPISMTEWKQFQEQCKLVVEENHLLMEQLDLQQNKEKEIHKTYMQEASKLSQKVSLVEREKAQLKLEVDELRAKYDGLKRKYDEGVINSRLQLDMDEHDNIVAQMKRASCDDKARHSKELADINAKLESMEVEKGSLSRENNHLREINKQLEDDIRSKQRNEKKFKKDMELMQITKDESEMIAAKIKQYLANVLKAAETTSKERDNLAQSVKDQEKDKLTILRKLVSDTSDMTKMKEKMKVHNLKRKEKLTKIATRLKEQDNDFSLQRQEYEREIKQLRNMIRDRDDLVNVISAEKKEVLEDLETMWQAASKDNERMQDTIRRTNRKLQEHVGLRSCLEDELEPNDKLDFVLKQCVCDESQN